MMNQVNNNNNDKNTSLRLPRMQHAEVHGKLKKAMRETMLDVKDKNQESRIGRLKRKLKKQNRNHIQ